MKLDRSHVRFTQPVLNAFGEKIDEGRMIVGAGDLLKRFSARIEKCVTSLLLKLFERFQTVRGKRRRHYEECFYSRPGQPLELVISVWGQPRFASESRLKRN